jgi:AraC-like DNA-binding protein
MPDALRYHEFTPPDELREHIRCIWRLEGPAAPAHELAAEPIVPDGCVEMVLNMGAPFVRHVPGAGSHRQPRRLVAGQITRAVTIAPSGDVDLWGIRFHPWAAPAFLGVSGAELRDQFLPVDEVSASLDKDLSWLDDVDGDGDGARHRVILSALARRAAHVDTGDAALPHLVNLASSGTASMSVRELARRARLSTRRVQALFRDGVGLAPKQLMRIARFQRALGLARASLGLSWSAIAATAGYYDQAHLIHEAQDIVGCTPGELLGRNAELTGAFLVD